MSNDKAHAFYSAIQRLEHYYWSPRHPREYVVESLDGSKQGIGLIAHQDYGAFNLVWATVPLTRLFHHRVALLHFNEQASLNQQELEGAALGDWLTLLRPDEFKKWYTLRRDQVSPPAVERIDLALNVLDKLPPVRQRYQVL